MTPDNLYNLADDTPPTATMDLANPDLEAAKYLAMVQSWPQILAKSGEDRLDTPDRVEIVQQIAVVSQSEVAWQRGHEIALLAKRRAPEPLRLVTMAVAALFSGLVVGGSAMQALEGRSALAVGVGGVAAGGAAVAANLGASRYLKHRTMQHHTQQFLAQLED